MCGRYTLAVDTKTIQMTFNPDVTTIDWQPTYSITPGTRIPIIREQAGQRGLTSATWGFRPGWAKGSGPRPINARIETVASNRLFAQSFTQRRTLIPMTGYIEWLAQEVPGRNTPLKLPYAIAASDRSLLAAAGLWTAFRAAPQDPWQVSCTIMTTDAVDPCRRVHERMPVLLPVESWDWWVDPQRPGRPQDLPRLIDAAQMMAEQLEVWSINPRVNRIQAIDPHDPTLLDAYPKG